jgi:hypothetical protein
MAINTSWDAPIVELKRYFQVPDESRVILIRTCFQNHRTAIDARRNRKKSIRKLRTAIIEGNLFNRSINVSM